jgi:hypothetical protein
MRFEEGFIDMAQEYKIYFSTKDNMSSQELANAELQKSIEFQLIKTSAHYFDLDLPEKYKQALVSNKNS